MRCPHCKSEQLITLEHKSVEVDYCDRCRGVWLDAGELELLFGDEQAAREFLSVGAPAVVPKGEKPRRCPECDARMTKESTTGADPITFDHCPHGDGLWLDRGELARALHHARELGRGTRVAEFLQEIFPRVAEA